MREWLRLARAVLVLWLWQPERERLLDEAEEDEQP